MHSSAITRISLACALLAWLSVPTRESAAQQVVAHATLLPAEAGLNPLGLGTIATDPVNPDLFVVSGRGLSVVDRGAPSFVSFELGPGGSSFANAIAFDPLHRQLLVSDGSNPALIVIDGASRTLLLRLPLPFVAGRVALDPTGGRAYLLSASGNQIAAVDLAMAGVISSAPLPDQPSRLAVNPATGRIYVTSGAAGATWVLEPSLALKTTIPSGAQSGEIALNPVAARGYVVRSDGNVAILDLGADTLIKTVQVDNPRLVVAHTGTGFAYVSSATNANPPLTFSESQIVAIDASDNRLTPVRVGGNPAGTAISDMVLDPAAGKLYVSELAKLVAGRVTAFNTSPGLARLGAGFSGQSAAAPLALSPATGKLYIASGNSVLTEMDPTTFAATQIVLGVNLSGGVMNEGARKSFNLDDAGGRAIMLDLQNLAAAPTLTPTGAGPQLAAIAEAAGEVYVVNQLGRSISVLDALTGAKLRDRSNLGADVSLGFALDAAAPGGPRGLIIGLTATLFPASPAWVQTYEPASSDRLTGVNGNCLTSACVAAAAVAANPVSHRFYNSALYVTGTTLPAASLAVFDPAATPVWRNIAIPDAPPFPSSVLSYDADHNRVLVGADSTTQTRVMAIEDVASPVLTPIVTAATATAIELTSTNIYVAEAGAGQIEIFDKSSLALLNPVNTGGSPVDLRVLEAVPYLWVQNDGLAVPGIQVYDVSGQRVFLSDIGFFGLGRSLVAARDGLFTAIDNQHGTVVVIDPAAAPSDLQIDPAALPDGNTLQAYATTLVANGGSGPSLWELTSGRLPPGLLLDPASGAISGTPTAEGLFSFSVRLTDSGVSPAQVDMEDFQIQVLDLRIVTQDLPSGLCGSFWAQLLAAGGTPPYTWSSTALPAGLVLDPGTGIVNGVPTAQASCPPLVDFTVTDGFGTTRMASLCVEVAPAGGSLPVVGNTLLAFRSGVDVVLELPALAPPVSGYNIYKSFPPTPVTWTQAGGTPSTTSSRYSDLGAVPAAPTLGFYASRSADSCGNESADPLF